MPRSRLSKIEPETGPARGDDLQPVARVLHYTRHPVNVFGLLQGGHSVSPDWIGARAKPAYAARHVALDLRAASDAARQEAKRLLTEHRRVLWSATDPQRCASGWEMPPLAV